MPDDLRLLPAQQVKNVDHPDRALGELAARQHGVVARRQLAAIGISRQMAESRVARGRLVRLHRGVYAVGHARLRREGWWMAAVLAAGPGALLSHRDAAELHGLRPHGSRRRIEVTTSRRASSTDRIRVYATTVLDSRDAVTSMRVPVTGVARTLVDLAAVATPTELRKALNEAERQRSVDLRDIERAMAASAQRRGKGHAAMRDALAELRAVGAPVTRSELEDRFLALLDAHEMPRPLTNHWIEKMEVDACWPAQRLVVELDGWGAHATRRAFQDDRERGNTLGLAGWQLLRFTWADVTQRPQETATAVRRALRLGRRYPPDP